MERLTELMNQHNAALGGMEDILQAAADDDDRDLTDDELIKYQDLDASAKGLEVKIEREKDLQARKAAAAKPLKLPNNPAGENTATVPAQPKEKIPGANMAIAVQAVANTQGTGTNPADWAENKYGSEAGEIVANLEQSTDEKGGLLINEQYSSDFVDITRPLVAVRDLGARSVPMPNGNLTTRRKLTGTSAGYIGERQKAPLTGMTVGNFKMSAKKLAALVPITNDLIRHANFRVLSLILEDLRDGVAVKEDQQFLRGVGGPLAPAGIKDLIDASHIMSATGGIDLQNIDRQLSRLRLAIKLANLMTPNGSFGYIISPRTEEFLMTLRDGNGNKAYPEIKDGMIGKYPFRSTTSVPDNLGVGTNESEITFGDFSQFLIGDTMNYTIATSDQASYEEAGVQRNTFEEDETLVRLIGEHDTTVRYDRAFAVLTGVTWGD